MTLQEELEEMADTVETLKEDIAVNVIEFIEFAIKSVKKQIAKKQGFILIPVRKYLIFGVVLVVKKSVKLDTIHTIIVQSVGKRYLGKRTIKEERRGRNDRRTSYRFNYRGIVKV